MVPVPEKTPPADTAPSARGPDDGPAHIETVDRIAVPGERGEVVFYRRVDQSESRPGLISKGDIAEAAIQLAMTAAALVRPARSWPAFCGRTARMSRPPGGRDRLGPFADAVRSVLGEVSDPDTESLFGKWWESLHRRRMMYVREYVGGGAVRFTLTGRENLDAAAAAGRGAILWAADFTSQTLAGKRALCEAGFSLHQVSSSQHGFRSTWFGNACLNRLQVRVENRYLAGRLTFEGYETGMLIRKAMRSLRRGGFVVFANNVFAGRSFVEMPLGARGFVSMATTPIALALREGVPLFYISAIEREPLAHYELRIGADLTAGAPSAGERGLARPGNEIMARIALKARDELLQDLHKAPDQFLNWLPLARPAAPGPGQALPSKAAL